MNSESGHNLSGLRQVALVALRILIGWHFLYEGYYKLILPGWSSDGVPLAPWSSAGYIRAATGPAGKVFQRMIDAGWTPWIDNAVKIGLLLVGVSLVLGLFTRTGCWGALFLLSVFYLSSVPLSGTPQPGSEGAYLIINKTLIEAAAVLVVLVFDTGAIAGLDLVLFKKRRLKVKASLPTQVTAEQPVEQVAIAADTSGD